VTIPDSAECETEAGLPANGSILAQGGDIAGSLAIDSDFVDESADSTDTAVPASLLVVDDGST
jgi:hypothetical protein